LISSKSELPHAIVVAGPGDNDGGNLHHAFGHRGHPGYPIGKGDVHLVMAVGKGMVFMRKSWEKIGYQGKSTINGYDKVRKMGDPQLLPFGCFNIGFKSLSHGHP